MSNAASDAVTRAAELAALGFAGTLGREQIEVLLHAFAEDPDARVRGAAFGALVRSSPAEAFATWPDAIVDPDPAVRRRAAEVAPALSEVGDVVGSLATLLADRDVTVVEAAAWALGELGALAVDGHIDALVATARAHRDPLAREAAVAALGALGDPAGLDAILQACSDRPAVRRRAVLALAPFSGPAIDAALAAARDDHDWQVRQAAEDLDQS